MQYVFQYLDPSSFNFKNEELKSIIEVPVNKNNAKEIGVISLRAIREYEEIKKNFKREKTSLKIWIREQRQRARNHGRVFKYKGASKTRASINAEISNINDEILNQMDLIKSEIENNFPDAKKKLNQCLQFYSQQEIEQYEPIYIKRQEEIQSYNKKIQEHKKNINYSLNEKNSWISFIFFSCVALPFSIMLFYYSFAIWQIIICWGIIVTAVIILSIIRIKSINKFIPQERKRIRQAEKKLQQIQEQIQPEVQNKDIFDSEVWEEIMSEKLKHDKKNIQNDINQVTLQKKREPYTVDWLQNNFDSFQAAKDYFDIRAKGWETLAKYLNEINDK
jgi:hypothetical protein